MQLAKLFGPILVALVGEALGAPADVEASSVSSQASPTTLIKTTSTDIGPRPNLVCKPTGPGYCTLEIYSARPPVGRVVVLYDYNCDTMGIWPAGSGVLPANGEWSLHSRLPYSVELKLHGDDLEPQGEIWYKGRKTDINAGWRYNCNDFSNDTECLRLAFNCS
ncbi:hypothetical protein GGTG_09817 [Gaeumannomyces tritici R3-111a-1]|uniref:Uncharacterized protein n=1 Tax=Gaeumannomyces tritici (strain R3-111a-1) TaxID=644352 RepID=J3P8I3_GAET3|nr:hypothetical protein GGTG_09817 [Gaeumannomyces tritici R3-111a-1]EJT72966.1 hypothetical protein GGTG_09817 [Gaeumannomyces tritici R3-111a-1]